MVKTVTMSHVVLAMSLMAILTFSAGSGAFASKSVTDFTPGNNSPAAEHHKPDHDKGNDNGNGPPAFGDEDEKGNSKGKGKGPKEWSPMFQPVPTSLDEFRLDAEGTAITKRDGRDGPFTDAEVTLRGSVLRDEGNHFRFLATGTVELEDGEYDVVDAQGIIIFFKNQRGNHIAGLLHIVGKNVVDEDGNDLGKFRFRALVLPDSDSNTWRIILFPAGKLGPHTILVNMEGTIKGLGDGGTPPPTPGSPALDHFQVSAIPSSVSAGSPFSVTVTAHMSNGTLLKSYEEKAKITDATGSVRPIVTPRFEDGVFRGALNITKASSSDKVTFTDVETRKSGSSNSFSVLAGTLAVIDLTPSEASVKTSGKAQFSARGADKFGNELSGLVFVWTLSSPNFGSIATAGSKANFTAASSVSSDTMVNLTASSGGKSDKSEITINPSSPQVLDHFVIGNVSTPQTAGAPFQLSVTAVNSTGGTIPSYSGPMTLIDSTGSLNRTISSGFAGGVWIGNVNITKAGDEIKITARDSASPSKKGTSNEFEVIVGALHHFDINPISNQTAGTQFNAVVKARDAFGNLKSDYVGNVTLGTNNGASPLGNLTKFVPAWHNFTSADNGEFAFAATMYNVEDNVTVSVTGSGKSGISNQFDVTPGAVAKIVVSPTSATVSPGGKATFTAQASDSFGNTVTGANFEWSVSPNAIGKMDEVSATAAEFTASETISSDTPGTVTASVGSVDGTATITVDV